MKEITELDADSDEMKQSRYSELMKAMYILSEKICETLFSAATGAYWPHEDGKPFHTFRTATVLWWTEIMLL